jgi:hypothetical protein
VSASLHLFRYALVLSLSGCASSPYPSVNDPMPPPDPGSIPANGVVQSTSARGGGKALVAVGTLQRADVERVVDAGLGRFLGHVALEPSLPGGKFAGWSIVGFDPPEFSGSMDLQPGDVVTKVNGMAIEREIEAFDAFQAVRQAPQLEITFLRQNQPRTLRFTIVGAPSPSLPKAAPTADNTPPSAPARP